ncbi:hypothetical protein IAU60_001457 [Kwoniella sp. DSM 27419]
MSQQHHLTDYMPGEPIEPTVATGAQMIAKEEAHESGNEPAPPSRYIFKFLREDRPLPGRTLAAVMLGVLFLLMFLAGWNDGSQGPLLPSLQEHYHVNYLVIATIWLANFAGFMVAGVTNVHISDHFGFGIAAPFGASMQALAYCLLLWGPPFPLFVIAYVFNGFGLGLQDAQVNSLVSRLPNNETKMFLMHAMYGFGATISPFVATAFVKHEQRRVYLYFAASLGLAALTCLSMVVVFRGRTEDQVVGRRPVVKGAAGDSTSKLSRILRTPVIHAMAFYMVIYVGTEVMIGGWATSFLIDERGGDDNAGYVTAGYFGGLTVGRVILIPVTARIGHHMSIYIYSIFTLVLTLIIWFTHNLIGNAVCFSLVGVFLGPMYPIVMNVVVDIIPGELQGGTIGWIASLGQAGSAILPFVTGAISDKYGVWVLQPLTLALMGTSMILWFFVTRESHTLAKKNERRVSLEASSARSIGEEERKGTDEKGREEVGVYGGLEPQPQGSINVSEKGYPSLA